MPEISEMDAIREFIEDCGVLVYPGHPVGIDMSNPSKPSGSKNKLLIRCGDFKRGTSDFRNQIVKVDGGVLSIVTADNAPTEDHLFSCELADPECLVKLREMLKSTWGYDKGWRHK